MNEEAAKILAEAIVQSLISPNVDDSNWEPANVVDALAKIAAAIGSPKISFADIGHHTQANIIEAHGRYVVDAAEDIAGAVSGVGDAINNLAAAVREHRKSTTADWQEWLATYDLPVQVTIKEPR